MGDEIAARVNILLLRISSSSSAIKLLMLLILSPSRSQIYGKGLGFII